MVKRQERENFYYTVSAANPPTLRVQPGETFVVETELCSGDWLRDPTDTFRPEYISGGRANPSSGCIYVEGAAPGDVLAVTLEEVEPAPLGYTAFGNRSPLLPDSLRRSAAPLVTRTVRIREGYVEWAEGKRLPAHPMVGVIATAPADEVFHLGRNGPYGGNLDAQEVAAGATVYLPVYVPGGLLHLGDVHAIQGDGEICGAGGIECAATLRLRAAVLPRPERMSWPRFRDETHVGCFACARPAEEAFRLALHELIYWLADEYGLDEAEAFLLLGQVLEARCTQFVDPLFTYVAKVRREFVEG